MDPVEVLFYHYVIVRSDISLGDQLAQVIHAAGESVTITPPPTTHAVALHASHDDLCQFEQTLTLLAIPHTAIREPDRSNELMAIGLPAQPRTKAIRKLMARFKLAKG
jgi:hypothetical protein